MLAAGQGAAVAKALVSRERLWYGDLPAVCVKTGMPADRSVPFRSERLPPWTFLLLLAGLVPFFIAALFVRERVEGRLPITARAYERYRGHRRPLRAGWGLTLGGVAAAALATEPWFLVLTAVGVLTVLVAEFRRSGDWFDAVPVRGTPFVELRRVHPAFVDAVATDTTSVSTRVSRG